jgi:hypothetical protein
MKFKFTLILFFCYFSISYAEQVDSVKAIKVATNFFGKLKPLKTTPQFKRVDWHSKIKSQATPLLPELPTLFIFNNSDDGFVIVSGSDKTTPILGFSTTGKIDPSNIPPALTEWLNWKEKEIKYLVQNSTISTKSASAEWVDLENNLYTAQPSMSGKEPLIKTLWGQGTYYNDMCPVDANSGYSNKHVPVGCAATAMSQIMKYWEYPVNGIGSHSYTHSVYGLQSANFATTTYDWSSMPKYATAVNEAVATLSYHCGVSIDMNYGPTGSSASMSTVARSLNTYFNYLSTLSMIQKSDYTTTAWYGLIKSDIDNNMPVLLRGCGEDGSGGHLYICDGYTINNYFHINWGWTGSYNGYFLFDDLTPGSNDYTFSQYAVIGIKPSSNSCAVYPGTLSINSGSGSSGTFRIVSNTSWTASSNQTWLNLSATSGNGCSTVTVTANSINTTGSNRTATININVSGVLTKTIIVTQSSTTTNLPNLLPYNPSDWSDKIVLSNVKNTNTDNALTPSDSVYMDFAFANSGTTDATGLFYCWLSLDSINVVEGIRNGLKSGYYSSSKDVVLGRLSEGTHKIKMIVDPINEINESNENDNVYIKTFSVSSNGVPFLNTSVTSLSYAFRCNSKTINISSNTNWNIVSDQTWLIPGVNSGSNNSFVTVTAAENSTTAVRYANLTISATGITPITITVTQVAGFPNLTVYKPTSWGDKIVISNQLNTLVDDIIFNTQTVYVDYSYINSGNKKTEGTFYTKLFLNDELKRTVSNTDTLGSGWYNYFSDFSLGTLYSGGYTLKLVVDETGTITESDESDNTYTKQFVVYDAATSLTATPLTSTISSLTATLPIDINCVGKYTISNTNSWITLNSTSGTGNGQISVSVEANPNITSRTGTFTISNAVMSKVITINQDGKTNAIKDINQSSIQIFPNPVTDKLFITCKDSKINNIVIVNSMGIVIDKKEDCGNEYILDVTHLSAGYYILIIEINHSVYRSNFIKQ